MVDHPFRTAATATAGVYDDELLEVGVLRTILTLDVDEELGDFEFTTGEIPLAVLWVATGYIYTYDATDATTPDDGLTTLVTGNGLRYAVEDAASISLNSVLDVVTAPAGSEVVGDAYRVDAAATGDFAGKDDDIAVLTRRGWVFASPEIGMTVLNEATGFNEQFLAAGWGMFAAMIGDAVIYPSKLLFPLGVSVESETNTPPGSPAAGVHYLTGAAPSGAWSGHARQVARYEGGVWAFYTNYGGARIYNKDSRQELIYDASTGLWLPALPIAPTAQGRLTLETGVAISTADQTAKATLYFTPFRGNSVALYVNGGWALRTFSEISLSLAGYTSGKPYDIFLYDNAGTLTLESLVWTNDTTRATALTTQDGVLVKSGDATRRYLGTIYTSATGQCEDSAAKRYVWNYYNRCHRPMRVVDTTNNWSYTTSTWRQANASAANALDFVIGVSEDEVVADAVSIYSSGNPGRTGIGLDSTSSPAANSIRGATSGAAETSMSALWRGFPGVGRHYLAWLEYGASSGVFYGDAGSVEQAGITGGLVG